MLVYFMPASRSVSRVILESCYREVLHKVYIFNPAPPPTPGRALVGIQDEEGEKTGDVVATTAPAEVGGEEEEEEEDAEKAFAHDLERERAGKTFSKTKELEERNDEEEEEDSDDDDEEESGDSSEEEEEGVDGVEEVAPAEEKQTEAQEHHELSKVGKLECEENVALPGICCFCCLPVFYVRRRLFCRVCVCFLVDRRVFRVTMRLYTDEQFVFCCCSVQSRRARAVSFPQRSWRHRIHDPLFPILWCRS